jgi:2-polyprenyl-6-hydroxyphenyl methylase / 3-demethylubiquinone-9 3-methyltransferase
MAQCGAQVTGIDLSDQALKVAQLHSLESGVEVDYRQTSAEEFAQERPASFDVVTCMELLEHVPDPASTVRACAELAKAGSHVFFSTINRNLKSYLFAVIGAEYVLRMLPRGTHRYEKFVKPSELAAHCRQAGLGVREIVGMTYNPLTGQYALGTDTDVNYLMHCTT